MNSPARQEGCRKLLRLTIRPEGSSIDTKVQDSHTVDKHCRAKQCECSYCMAIGCAIFLLAAGLLPAPTETDLERLLVSPT